MKLLALALTIFIFGGTATASTQSLGELAKKEKERRQNLTKKKKVHQFNDRHLGRVHFGRPAIYPGEAAQGDEESGGSAREAQVASDDSSKDETDGNLVLASLSEETSLESRKDVEFTKAVGAQPPADSGARRISTTGTQFQMPNRLPASNFHLRGALYADLFRATYNDGLSTSQLSTRAKFEMGRRPGEGWRLFFDVRDKFNNGARNANRLIVYDARVIYEDQGSPVELSVGQMNLYNSAGVGQLLGGVLGYQINPAITVGGYAGLEPDIYDLNVDLQYQKYGVYTQYLGTGAKSAALSYNAIRFEGRGEREFIYASGLFPIANLAVLYGNMEYEVGDYLAQKDRLSRVFLNARYDPTTLVQLSAYYSSGKGLDFHRFLLEQSQNPARNSPELERFYYSKTFGARVTFKPHRRVRLYLAKRESEQKDRMIRNHTTQLGGSAWNIGGSGISLYGSYNINRGDASESDSYRISMSRDFGPLSWTAYYSTTFNGIRFNAVTGRPSIVRISDRSTVSNDFFFSISTALALSLVHDYSSRGVQDENTLFFRVIYRF